MAPHVAPLWGALCETTAFPPVHVTRTWRRFENHFFGADGIRCLRQASVRSCLRRLPTFGNNRPVWFAYSRYASPKALIIIASSLGIRRR